VIYMSEHACGAMSAGGVGKAYIYIYIHISGGEDQRRSTRRRQAGRQRQRLAWGYRGTAIRQPKACMPWPPLFSGGILTCVLARSLFPCLSSLLLSSRCCLLALFQANTGRAWLLILPCSCKCKLKAGSLPCRRPGRRLS